MTEGGAAARGRRRGTRRRRLWNRMLACLARHHDRGPTRSLGRHGVGHGPCIIRWQSAKSLILRTKMAGEVSAELHLSHAWGDREGRIRELFHTLERDARSQLP